MTVAQFGCLAVLLGAAAMGLAQGQSTQGQASTGSDPQIVRVSYVQGDVRISRGKEAEKLSHSDWEKAAVDLPIETGYSLVTGDGRAEIEFEDTSVAYLAENSVLVFNDIHTSGGIPQTELALLSGAMSLQVQPMSAGEQFKVRTPTDQFAVRYPMKVFLRVNSYLDGMSLTPLGYSAFRVNKKLITNTDVGQTILYRKGQRITGEKPPDESVSASFDQWVLQKVIDRNETMAETMKQAGLRAPVPGLEQLKGQGHFYPCPPYGMCWEPTNGFAGQLSDAEKAAMARQTVSAATLAKGGPNQAMPMNQQPNMLIDDSMDFFPCSPFRMFGGYGYGMDPMMGNVGLMNTGYISMMYPQPYDWAVCHTGTWIRRDGQYGWVPGTKRHHHPPVHWVKDHRAVGYVPIHPKDVAGKPPVGLKDGIVHPIDKHGARVEMLAASDTRQVKVLGLAPREFRRDPIVPLQRSETPQVKAYALKDAGTGVATHGTEVHYDHRTQTYMVAQQSGGGSGQKLEPIGGRGNSLQSHVGWSPAVTGQSAFANNNNFGNFNSNPSFNNGGGSFGGSTFSGAPATAAPAAPSGGAGTAR